MLGVAVEGLSEYKGPHVEMAVWSLVDIGLVDVDPDIRHATLTAIGASAISLRMLLLSSTARFSRHRSGSDRFLIPPLESKPALCLMRSSRL